MNLFIMLIYAAFVGVSLIFMLALVLLLNVLYRRRFVDDFNECTVFITGCDRGFGHFLALKLDRLGVQVYAGCLTEEGAASLRSSAVNNLKTVILDITNEKSVENAKEFVAASLSHGQVLWGLVNNAGIFGDVCFDLMNVADYRKTMEVNYFGTIRVVETFLPLIKKAKGRVVTVTSITQRAMIGACPYTASKAALSMYCDGLRRAVRRFGVSASTIEPGFHSATGLIDIDTLKSGMKTKWANLSDEAKFELGEETFFVNELESQRLLFDRVPFHKWNKTDTVLDAIIHALGSKQPKVRYVCGWDAIITAWFYHLCPDWISDFACRAITRKHWYNIFQDYE